MAGWQRGLGPRPGPEGLASARVSSQQGGERPQLKSPSPEHTCHHTPTRVPRACTNTTTQPHALCPHGLNVNTQQSPADTHACANTLTHMLHRHSRSHTVTHMYAVPLHSLTCTHCLTSHTHALTQAHACALGLTHARELPSADCWLQAVGRLGLPSFPEGISLCPPASACLRTPWLANPKSEAGCGQCSAL